MTDKVELKKEVNEIAVKIRARKETVKKESKRFNSDEKLTYDFWWKWGSLLRNLCDAQAKARGLTIALAFHNKTPFSAVEYYRYCVVDGDGVIVRTNGEKVKRTFERAEIYRRAAEQEAAISFARANLDESEKEAFDKWIGLVEETVNPD